MSLRISTRMKTAVIGSGNLTVPEPDKNTLMYISCHNICYPDATGCCTRSHQKRDTSSPISAVSGLPLSLVSHL